METQKTESKEVEYDRCIRCKKKTIYPVDTPINERKHYKEGAGQLCPECEVELYE